MARFSFADRLRISWQVMTGGYEGASRRKRSLSSWVAPGGDADTDMTVDIPTLRERSRDAVRNIPIAAGILNTKVTNVVGTGLRFNSQIDREYLGLPDDAADEWEAHIERLFNGWASSPDCDAERTLNFYDMQALAWRSVLEAGDTFVTMPYIERPGSDVGLRVQLIEADRVGNPNGQRDTLKLTAGIEKDSSGAPVACHIARTHPGRYDSASTQYDRVEMFGAETGRPVVLHLYHKIRIGQTRGIPDLAPVTEALKQLGRYSEAEIDAAVTTAFFAVVTKTPQRQGLGPAALGGAPDSNSKTEPYKVGPALVLDLKDGEDFDTVDPSRPNSNFDPFVLAVLRQIGAALELPFEILIKHFTSSYSAARAALEDAKRFFKGRRAWLAAHFCQPIVEAFIWEMVASGKIAAPGFLTDPDIRRAYLGDYRDQWIGPAWAQIDPLKEFKAAELAEDRGWKTATENTAEQTGGDWQRKIRRRQKEQALREEYGLLVTPTNDETGQL